MTGAGIFRSIETGPIPAWSPVPAGARVDEIDVVRGMALGGMLLVNLGAFRGAARLPLLHQTGLDWIASLLVLLLADGKFYPLFAFLFGWGIARRQAAGGARFFRSNLRRMAVLAFIGLLHAGLLWQGDILFAYALIGALLPLLRCVPPRVTAALALCMLLLSVFLAMPGPGANLQAAYSGWITPPLAGWLGLPSRGPWASVSPVLARLAQFAWKLAYFPDWLGNYAAFILAGYASSRIAAWPRFSLRLVFLLALPLNLFTALSGAGPYLLPPVWAGFLRSLALSLGGPLLALGYAVGLARFYQAARTRGVLEPLRKIGRMPLTTYLSQSLVAAIVFTFFIPGRFPSALLWPLAGGIYAFQLLFASLFLRRFRHGPMEWLWRRFS